ncbi:MAG: response regulator [Rhodospirillales bacterium]|nr:response regulator [Rhodospirillales bacterium]
MAPESTIFIVDDDEAVQDSLRALLESADLKVAAYGSGRDFFAAFEKGSPGCVVLDIDLPGMNGLEVMRQLAEIDADMPVILISGRYGADALTRRHNGAALAVLEKPMRQDLLLRTIEEALAGERGAPAKGS